MHLDLVPRLVEPHVVFLLYDCHDLPDLHSFPTRRSSDLFRDHESFVFKPLQRGIHRARGRRIAAMQLLFQFLHYLVAVAGLVFEQFENDVLHVPRLEPATAAAPRSGPEETPGPKAEGEPVPCERSRHAFSKYGDVTRRYCSTIYRVNGGESGNRNDAHSHSSTAGTSCKAA